MVYLFYSLTTLSSRFLKCHHLLLVKDVMDPTIPSIFIYLFMFNFYFLRYCCIKGEQFIT